MMNMYPSIVRVIQDCEAVCDHMVTHAGRMPDVQSRAAQLQLLRDCADVCALAARYIASDSPFSRIGHIVRGCMRSLRRRMHEARR